jgi:Ca2+-binding EF-hand superfamily protein/thiol-disulfide isomerase/thioredoxin
MKFVTQPSPRVLLGILAALQCSMLSLAAEKDSLESQFARYDLDGSGQVTTEELTDASAFALMDGNRDGAITLDEARRAVAAGRLRGVKLPEPGAGVGQRASRDKSMPEAGSADHDSLFTEDVRQGPKPLKGSDVGVGRLVEDFEFTDINDQPHRLSDWQEAKAIVIAMTGTGCPLCLKYAPSLAEIEDRYRDQGVLFVFINPNESESVERVRESIEGHGFDGPYVRDLEERITRGLDVRTTTEMFVLDAARTLCYRGAVDDQYGFGYALEQPRHHYLTDALDAVLRGQQPRIAATSSPGCEMYYRGEALETASESSVTYHNRISRILLDNCVGCHREGGSAPFALETYDGVRDYAEMIGSVVRRGIMPPWFAAKRDSGSDSESETLVIHWANDRSLANADRDDLLTWVESGIPEGNPADAPLPRTYPAEWEIGQPDLVLQIPQPIAIQANGRMPYQHRRVETELTEDRWVQSVEIRPTDPSVVHHVLVFVQDPQAGDDERGIDEESGFFAAYVPGNTYQVYPPGFAKKLPAGSRLVFQLHYTPNGTATMDQTRLGIRFADQPPKRVVRNRGIANHRIEIPPGADNHRENASLVVPSPVRLLALMPHMHLRGKAFRYDIVFPSGRRETLLDVPRYDFNWQLEYRLAEPLDVPAGSRIELAGWYDNSEQNPANPNPELTVKWGPQTEDEMMLGYVEYVLPDEPVESGDASKASQAVRSEGSPLEQAFHRADANRDGKVTSQEFPRPRVFQRLDRDGNGVITLEEIRASN